MSRWEHPGPAHRTPGLGSPSSRVPRGAAAGTWVCAGRGARGEAAADELGEGDAGVLRRGAEVVAEVDRRALAQLPHSARMSHLARPGVRQNGGRRGPRLGASSARPVAPVATGDRSARPGICSALRWRLHGLRRATHAPRPGDGAGRAAPLRGAGAAVSRCAGRRPAAGGGGGQGRPSPVVPEA